jgi:hypothetical protein
MIFPSILGTPINPNNVLNQLKALLTKAGLRDMRFRDLHHTSITLVLNEIGVPVKEIQHRAGHATTSTTINMYGGESTSKLDEMVAQSLDELIIPVRNRIAPKLQQKRRVNEGIGQFFVNIGASCLQTDIYGAPCRTRISSLWGMGQP